MGDMTLPGNPPVSIVVRRNSRARRMTLRVSRLDGRVTLTIPRHVPEHAARSFIGERTDWVRSQLGKVDETVRVADGTVLSVDGRNRRVVLGRPPEDPADMAAPSLPGLVAILKNAARERLLYEVDRYSEKLGRDPSSVALRDPRSRWGSCSSAGRLMFSWRLILAPPKVLSYVVAHEVAHLKHMDHSSAFWDTVEELFPAHLPHRHWLREQGVTLHQYQFHD